MFLPKPKLYLWEFQVAASHTKCTRSWLYKFTNFCESLKSIHSIIPDLNETYLDIIVIRSTQRCATVGGYAAGGTGNCIHAHHVHPNWVLQPLGHINSTLCFKQTKILTDRHRFSPCRHGVYSKVSSAYL